MGNFKSYHNERILGKMQHRVEELNLAIRDHKWKKVRRLIAQGVNINLPVFQPFFDPCQSYNAGTTPLIMAVWRDNRQILEVGFIRNTIFSYFGENYHIIMPRPKSG